MVKTFIFQNFYVNAETQGVSSGGLSTTLSIVRPHKFPNENVILNFSLIFITPKFVIKEHIEMTQNGSPYRSARHPINPFSF